MTLQKLRAKYGHDKVKVRDLYADKANKTTDDADLKAWLDRGIMAEIMKIRDEDYERRTTEDHSVPSKRF